MNFNDNHKYRNKILGKRFLFYWTFLLLYFSLFQPCFSQVKETIPINKILEAILSDAPETFDYSELYDKLSNLNEHPLSLNSATKEELGDLFFLNEVQIDEIVGYREKYKGFLSLYELQTLISIDSKTLQWLLYFVCAEPSVDYRTLKFKDYILKGTKTVQLRYESVIERQKGYSQPDSSQTKNFYPGSPGKLYFRMVHKNGQRLSYGLTAEKDQGEQFFKGNQKSGFDFYSAHFFKIGGRRINTIALGDYHLSFGQGLTCWSGMTFRSFNDFASVYKSGSNISPYRSANEYNFLRGTAIKFKSNKSDFTLFYSNKLIDGNILNADSLQTMDQEYFNLISFTGYHRTDTEMKNKKTVREQITGGHYTINLSKLKFGLTAAVGGYSKSIEKADKPVNYYDFSGKSFTNLGWDYTFSYMNFLVFGELGFDGKTFANISSIFIKINPRLSTTLLYRNYPAAYHATYANAFRIGGETSNEKGLYFSFLYQLSKRIKINGYFDKFSFPWLKYQVDQPSAGYQYLFHAEYLLDYKTSMSARIKFDKRQTNLPENETCLNEITDIRKFSVKYGVDYRLSGQIRLETGLDYTKYYIQKGSTGEGFLLRQDIQFFALKEKLMLALRYCVFFTDDYASGIYSYENDMPGTFSIPVNYDKGARYYLLARYNLNEHTAFWFKLARTSFFDKTTVGSGLSEIQGNHKTDVKGELVWKFR